MLSVSDLEIGKLEKSNSFLFYRNEGENKGFKPRLKIPFHASIVQNGKRNFP